MATYFLRVNIFSRGRGARITRAAAYRAGERIRDHRMKEVHDFSDRRDVVHKEVVLPTGLADSAEMGWARDRSILWNAVEHAGRQRNSRLAREVLVSLPHELTPEQRISVARTFSRELSDKYQNAVDLTIHLPRAGSDQRSHHAHLLMTTREVTARGLGARTTLELSGTERHARGLGPSKADFFLIRERWAQIANDALRQAGFAVRIDHRSLQEQGIDREPRPDIPPKIRYAELRSGRSTRAGDEIRARYQERVEARAKGKDELARVLREQKEEATRRVMERLKLQGVPGKDRGAEAARTWLALRETQKDLRTAADSAREWLEFSNAQKSALTAEDSARKWLELTATRQQADVSQSTPIDHAHEPKFGAIADDDADPDDDERRTTYRNRDNDMAL